jgi:hypothetical protein
VHTCPPKYGSPSIQRPPRANSQRVFRSSDAFLFFASASYEGYAVTFRTEIRACGRAQTMPGEYNLKVMLSKSSYANALSASASHPPIYTIRSNDK